MSLYKGSLATIVVEVPTETVSTIKISLNNNLIIERNVTKEKNTYCETINLDIAENIITISTYSREVKNISTISTELENKNVLSAAKKLQQSTINLYYLPELYEGSDDEAEDYDKKFFHAQEKEKRCASCHNMTSNIPTGEDVFEDVTQTTCYSCHKTKLNTRNTHAPAANWRCVDCHNGKIGEYNMEYEGLSKYLAPDPIKRSCEDCHDNLAGWDYNRYTHGPVNDGRCIRCHNPHGSDNEFFLRKPIWDLCTTCHAEKADGKHVVSSFVFSRNAGAHPTRSDTVKDPARPKRDFTCTSCHNPHGSAGIYLLRMKGSMAFGVCRRCHKK